MTSYAQLHPTVHTLIDSFGKDGINDRGEKVYEAVRFASYQHHGQHRKYTAEPYIVHPIEVMTIAELGAFGLGFSPGEMEDFLCGAVLHDVLEDTKTSTRDIEERFGPWVLSIVFGLTDISRPEHGDRRARKLIDLQHLASGDAWVHTIKLADIISNTRSIVRKDPEFAHVYLPEKKEQLEVLTKGAAPLLAIATKLVDAELLKVAKK